MFALFFLCGPALEKDYRDATDSGLSAAAIAACADEGDAIAEATLSRYEERLARGLAHVINVVDPEVIVLGGGLSKLERLYSNVPAKWDRYVFSDAITTRRKC